MLSSLSDDTKAKALARTARAMAEQGGQVATLGFFCLSGR